MRKTIKALGKLLFSMSSTILNIFLVGSWNLSSENAYRVAVLLKNEMKIIVCPKTFTSTPIQKTKRPKTHSVSSYSEWLKFCICSSTLQTYIFIYIHLHVSIKMNICLTTHDDYSYYVTWRNYVTKRCRQ